MYYIIINFPFSSVNDEQYNLVTCLNSFGDPTAVNDILLADNELFTPGLTSTSGNDTIYNWTGTLTGSVRAVDEEREDMWTPLVCSKLSFNMAVSDFPVWLMEYCNNNRAKVIVYKTAGGTKHEMWRGYLIAQTLNMTVVRNLLSCPLVAVDEVDMAKYMNFKETLTYVTNDHWCTVYGLMEHYHTLHHTRGLSSASPGFEKLYQIIGLSHTDRMMWHRDMRIVDDDGDPVNNLPDALVVNLDRWMQPDDDGKTETTWETVFNDLLPYLGVTFAVGSYGMMTVNDCYLLTCPTDNAGIQQYVYTFTGHSVTSHSNDQYATLNNPTKVGANLQISAMPDKYAKVKLTSKPERWEGHEYLTDKHYKPVGSGEVRFEWGEKDNSAANFKNLDWHKLKYTDFDAEEADYVDIPACADGEGYIMARAGILPYVDLDSCTGKTKPDATIDGTLDFITFKEGCCCIKLGQGNLDGIDEDKLLKNFFLIMNHNWDNMYRRNAHTMQNLHLADTVWLTLWPLGNLAPVHPSESHYLNIKMEVMFIRENMPSILTGAKETFLYLKAPNAQTANEPVFWDTTPAIIMPATESAHDFAEEGSFNASLSLWYDLYFQAYIHIGNFYYNGTTWVHVGSGETPPKCDVTLWNDTNEITSVTNVGQRVIASKNYYYSVSNPYRGSNIVDRYTNQTSLISDIGGISIHNQPFHGKIEIQILGQIRLQHGQSDLQYNSIPFVLINGIEINYTDDAELMDSEIDNKVEITMDAYSTTKETMETELKMFTPSVNGFFSNALLFDGGKAWHNLMTAYYQTYSYQITPETMIARRLSNQYGKGQLYVELETPVAYDDNVHNVCFRVQNLTEASGRFHPIKREFDYTRETMRVKLMRINTELED